jgi:hypothetical protein
MRALLACALIACGGSKPTKLVATSTPDTAGQGGDKTGPCAQLDEAACEAKAECHAEWTDAKAYVGCLAGRPVSCTKPSTNCDAPDPKCEAVGLRVQWVNDCHQNCVAASACS